MRPLTRLLPICIALCLITSTTLARLRPGFFLEYNTWQATDIILVKDDGDLRPRVKVVESWKGNLRPGDTIVVEGLLAAAAPKPKLDPDIAPFPDAVEGGYVVFFLAHHPGGVRLGEADGTWTGVVQGNEFLYTSAAFIREKVAHRFAAMGITNFEPDTLVSTKLSDAQFKAEVDSILKVQEDLRKAAAIASPEDRAKTLLPIAKTSYYNAQCEALRLLGKCGQPAVPMLRGLVISDSKHSKDDRFLVPISFEREIADALAAASGPNRNQELTAIVVEELAYWKKTAPTLKVGWWNELPSADEPRAHYGRLYSALKNLKGAYKAPPDDPVKQLRDLWASLPQLNDSTGLNQMIQACDEARR
jgi:hypothetical protein